MLSYLSHVTNSSSRPIVARVGKDKSEMQHVSSLQGLGLLIYTSEIVHACVKHDDVGQTLRLTV